MPEHVFRVQTPDRLTKSQVEAIDGAIRATVASLYRDRDWHRELGKTMHSRHAKTTNGAELERDDLYCSDCGRILEGHAGGWLVCPLVKDHPDQQPCDEKPKTGRCVVECGTAPGSVTRA